MLNKSRVAYVMILPLLLWLILFLVIPLGIIFIISFTTNDGFGVIVYEFSLDAYKTAINSMYLKIFLQSLLWAVIATVISLLIAYPFAYFTAHAGEWKNIILLLVMIPFWTNLLVRLYAWIIILNDAGIINNLLMKIGIISNPIKMMSTPFAMIITLVYAFLPFMFLPIYASIEQLNKSYLEASEDLGANPWKTFWHITFPLTLPGVLAGIIITFIPTLGIFAAADMFGGGMLIMIGNVIRDAFLSGMNWQLGSAVSIILMLLVLSTLYLALKLVPSDQKNSII